MLHFHYGCVFVKHLAYLHLCTTSSLWGAAAGKKPHHNHDHTGKTREMRDINDHFVSFRAVFLFFFFFFLLYGVVGSTWLRLVNWESKSN